MTGVRLFSSILALLSWLPAALAADALPQLGADIQQTSVSGLSSGGYMAGQFHTAHSKYVKGAAIVGAGPYACARSGIADSVSTFAIVVAANLVQAETGCTKAALARIADVLDGKRLASFAGDLASQGKIDPLEGLSRCARGTSTPRSCRDVCHRALWNARQIDRLRNLSTRRADTPPYRCRFGCYRIPSEQQDLKLVSSKLRYLPAHRRRPAAKSSGR